MQLRNGILRGHHYLQRIRKRTLRTFRRNVHLTKSSRTQTKTRKMLLLQKAHKVCRTPNLCRRNPTPIKSIAKMPAPKNPKEVKQFLGLVGYYRKFFPTFQDISRVLTHLTKKDIEFKWTPECENCFQILKEFLQRAPILKFPGPQPSTPCTQMPQNTHTQAC